jgi:hypothetical protein
MRTRYAAGMAHTQHLPHIGHQGRLRAGRQFRIRIQHQRHLVQYKLPTCRHQDPDCHLHKDIYRNREGNVPSFSCPAMTATNSVNDTLVLGTDCNPRFQPNTASSTSAATSTSPVRHRQDNLARLVPRGDGQPEKFMATRTTTRSVTVI